MHNYLLDEVNIGTQILSDLAYVLDRLAVVRKANDLKCASYTVSEPSQATMTVYFTVFSNPLYSTKCKD